MHSDLPFLAERMKINKYNKLVCNLYDKENCCSHRNVKTSLTSWINIKESYSNSANQETWLKEYINMNTKLRMEAKNDFEKNFFKLMNKYVFGKNYRKCKKAQRY